jgi:hypothetical protein
MSFCHLLEMPVKMTLGWEDYATVQGIYGNFGGVGRVETQGGNTTRLWEVRSQFQFVF